MFPSLCVLALTLSLSPFSFAQSLSLSPAPNVKDADASAPLDASYAGFGIEPSNLLAFTGGNEPNNFSITLMQNLADFSGKPPHIRLGGNTQDYMIYDSTYNDFAWKENDASVAQGVIPADSMIIGPSYFKALDRFPKDTPITYGLNMAYSSSDYLDRIVEAAKAAVDGLHNVHLYSFEVGNEPDLYLENKMRSGTWNGQTYTEEFLTRADAVYSQVLKPAGMPSLFFEPPATASTIGTSFEIQMLIDNGLLEPRNGNNYVSVWNQHDYFYFIGVTKTPITLDDLMFLDATNTQFKYWEKQVGIGLKTLPYVLREMSSVGPIGMHQISDTFGAALWTLNFFLYTASIGISSIGMHMTDNSNASAWQPTVQYGNQPFIRPQYYAHVAMAQIIGNGNGTTQIAELPSNKIDSNYLGYIRAYSAYANEKLQAVVLINSKLANASDENKGSFVFELNLGSENANKDVYLSTLTADGGDSLSGTEFNGMTFSDIDGKMTIIDNTLNTVRTSGSGSVSISVRDSQAIVANIGWLLGSNAVLTVNNTEGGGYKKKSSAGPTNTGSAYTAAWGGMFTTAFALASSLGSSGSSSQAEETESSKDKKSGVSRSNAGVPWKTVGFCLAAVILGLVTIS